MGHLFGDFVEEKAMEGAASVSSVDLTRCGRLFLPLLQCLSAPWDLGKLL